MKKKFLFGKNWFFEDTKLGESPTFTWCVLPEKNIFTGKSKFQKIEIFDTKQFGKILALDGLVQFSTKHEFVYHEMLVHPALISHPNLQKALNSRAKRGNQGSFGPQKVLIIGGGDGGALREVVKYPVKEIFLVDVDKKVIEVSKKYLPSLSGGAFCDKRLKIFNTDGVKFVKKYRNFFDIIINDSADPWGPSKVLWKTGFYKNISQALKGNGIAAFQTAYFQEGFAKRARKELKNVFPFFKVYRAFVGCFPFDEHTFSFGSKKINFDRLSFKKIKERYKKLNLKTKYYSPEIHFASGVLPKYLKEKIKK